MIFWNNYNEVLHLRLNRAFLRLIIPKVLCIKPTLIQTVKYMYRDDSIRNGRYEVNEDYLPDREPLIQQPIHISETFSSRPFDRPPPPPQNTLPQRPLSSFQAPLRPQRPAVIVDSIHAPSRKPVPVATEPAGSAVGILTGPVPSWQRPAVHKNGDPTNFEKCKCSFSFNCKSPGIKFVSTIYYYYIIHYHLDQRVNKNYIVHIYI